MHESVTGALNIYAKKPDAFDDDEIVLAQTFAGYAAVTLANATCTTPRDTNRKLRDVTAALVATARG